MMMYRVYKGQQVQSESLGIPIETYIVILREDMNRAEIERALLKVEGVFKVDGWFNAEHVHSVTVHIHPLVYNQNWTSTIEDAVSATIKSLVGE